VSAIGVIFHKWLTSDDVVMRACEGCRRRKIKCDAATTNTWPCSACTRLKLHCVPPMLQYDREYASQVVMGHDQNVDFGDSGGSGEEEMMHHMGKPNRPHMPGYHRDNNHYRHLSPQDHHGPGHSQHGPMPYSGLAAGDAVEPALSPVHSHFHQSPVYPSQDVMRQQEQWHADSDYASALVGSLKIDDDGVGGSHIHTTPPTRPHFKSY